MCTKASRQFAVGFALSVTMAICPALAARSEPACMDVVIIPPDDFNDKLTAIIFENARTCLTSLNKTYFQTKSSEPLKIYLYPTADEARNRVEDYGHSAAHTCIPVADDQPIMLEPLFASIAEHLVYKEFRDGPLWFRSGLVDFFSRGARVVDGNLISGEPCPSAALALRAEVAAETRLNIKKLYVSSDERYRQWETGPHLTAALLCWLEQSGHLADYVRLVREKGYELETLEEATGLSAGRINVELNKFIETDYCLAAYLAEAEKANEPDAKEKALQQALAKKPDYPQAQLALAKVYYDTGRRDLCRSTLVPLLAQAEGPYLLPAARLAADAFYSQNSYAQAREYYLKAWEKAQCCPARYELAYKIANCCHYLDEPQAAAEWYAKFLELNFRPDQDRPAADYAGKYVETFSSPTHATPVRPRDE